MRAMSSTFPVAILNGTCMLVSLCESKEKLGKERYFISSTELIYIVNKGTLLEFRELFTQFMI